MVLLRFAPSPTGPLHLGGLRMALYNYLYARKHGGKWIMRIEDTDTTRYVPGSVDGIRQALDWAGLDYDYGPGKDTTHGPYYQSERLDLYQHHARTLLDTHKAYRCFCSPSTLTSTRERLARLGSNASYDKACLHLTDEEVARKVKAGEKYTIRINDSIPPSQTPTQTPTKDMVFGTIRDAHLSLATDPILLKSDGFPTYHLASVIDDHEMRITHVLRGEEWLPSLPLHLDLYAHLGWTPPQYGHLPLLLNPDGSKMSKRNGDVRVVDYIKRGWEPEAILNWLALAGWGASSSSPASSTTSTTSTNSNSAPDSTTILTLPQLIDQFSLSAVTQRNSSLDPSKLEYINKRHIERKLQNAEKEAELADRIHDLVKSRFPLSRYTTTEMIAQAIRILDRRLITINDVPDLAPYLFIEPDHTTEDALWMLARVGDDLEKILSSALDVVRYVDLEGTPNADILKRLNEERDRLELKNKKAYMMGLRWALTGMKDGPGVVDIMKVLGKDRTVERLGVKV
ncbi:Glutamate--tRNA ligase mitochondrial [Paramarasmius palmivorus]|uniref:Glutamate--tRNA ligase, mitochondrial n=1 Tax=Paramarasmius palmivorus TaxID=297713 RepID=A0AAW0D7A9_9AGAR